MKLLTCLYALLATVTVATASPAPTTTAASATNTRPSSNPNDYRQFHLKTRLLHGQKNPRFNNLYVQLYHTGAGFDDAVLAEKRSETSPSYFNGTNLLFNVNEGHQSFYPYGTFMDEEVTYAGWETVQINIGLGNGYGRFFANSSGLQWSSDPGHPQDNGFAGWRVCDWWHNTPQLFWLLSYYNNTTPSSCSDVDLVLEYLGSTA